MIRSYPAENRRHLAMYLFWFLLWVGITVIGIALTPSEDGYGTHRRLGFPPCPSVMVFGRPCPGCGLTTSWTNVLHGQWSEALRAHLFGPIMYVAFTISAFFALWAWVKQRYFVYARAFNIAMGALVAVLLAYAAWRFVDPPASYTRNPLAPIVTARETS